MANLQFPQAIILQTIQGPQSLLAPSFSPSPRADIAQRRETKASNYLSSALLDARSFFVVHRLCVSTALEPMACLWYVCTNETFSNWFTGVHKEPRGPETGRDVK
jgi:hypothetical protein